VMMLNQNMATVIEPTERVVIENDG
jgi:hypothetical protein